MEQGRHRRGAAEVNMGSVRAGWVAGVSPVALTCP